MTGKLEGKVAVITGGTSGIGEATAQLFIAEGARVVFTGRSAAKGKAVAQRLGEHALYLQGDVSKEGDIKTAIDTARDQFGALDILFNNAGGPTLGGVDDLTSEQIDYGVHLLLSSVILGIKHAIPHMRDAGGGAIINNSSAAAIRYNQGSILYSCLKSAVTHYTRMAGVELGPLGIRVNSISPASITTPIFWGGSERFDQLSDEENTRKFAKLRGNLARATPLPFAGEPSDIAEAALYLASDAGRFVNCHDLVVDGGRTHLFRES